jgi:membrane-bound lytic murein transglycosylase F
VSGTGKKAAAERDALKRIRQSGEITMLTRNNAHCYYTYRGNPMGFEYDLAKAFADHLGVQLKVITSSRSGLIEDLRSGKGDFIAASMTITPSRKKLIAFSNEYLPIQQKLILHKENHKVKKIDDLEGKTIHVRRGTSYEERLKQLMTKGLAIKVKVHEDTPTEVFIGMVAKKEIEMTVANSNVALLNRRYYPDVKIAFPLERPQSLGWGAQKGEKELLREINEFFSDIKEDGTFEEIYEKNYANVEIFDYVDLKKYHKRLETRLPKYKPIIKRAAEKYGFDWRLIAAVIYQESHFYPNAKSLTGVKGLMQLTLNTAREVGVKDRSDPEQSIMGGVTYLRKLYDRYEDAKDPDRILIALASYNAGHRHIQDARKIAKEKNLDPNSWYALKETLPLLCYPRYYKKTRYGYCRGSEPVKYVDSILTFYDILLKKATTSHGSFK